MNRRQWLAGLLLLPWVLLSSCATVTSKPAAGADARSGISIATLADGSTRVDIATDVAFDYGSIVLRPDFAAQLSQRMKPYSQLPVRVSGFTDNVGAEDYNLELSRQRARAVAEALVALGFNARHLSVNGYGEGNPVASNADANGRYRNRHIELLMPARTDG